MGVTKDIVLEFVESMQKAKSPATTRRILPKRWRKSKTFSAANKHISIWKPEGGCMWSCKNGRRLTLHPVSLLTLTEVERVALQKICQHKLHAMDLGCHIVIPKDWNRNKRSKRSTFATLRKRTASTSALEGSKGKENRESCGVFGIPLGKCIANDMELRRRRGGLLQERQDGQEVTTPRNRHTRKSSSSSAALSSDSLSESEPRGQGSVLIDALSLSTMSPLQSDGSDLEDSPLAPHVPLIPSAVNTCCKHLETYGLRVLGIFRVGSSKKRLKQIRDHLESCPFATLGEEHNPHDVAALLKEYFRDLPDPIFTRDLYSAFVATRKIKDDEQRQHTLRLLVTLLPTPNRDTLWALLRFLSVVAEHSNDVIADGEVLPGNKMDSTNLATLFGPNLLHKARGGEYQVESLERAEERKDIIAVIKELIEKQDGIFKVKPEAQDEMYRRLLDSNPEALDYLLKKRGHSSQTGPDVEHETSASSVLDDSEGSMPHSPDYSSENDTGYPRSFTEAVQMGAVPQVSAVGQQRLQLAPAEGPLVYQTSPSPANTPQTHRPALRVKSDTAAQSGRIPNITLSVPANYRLSVPDTRGWFRSDRSVSPASPRISPSPKAMKTGTPDPKSHKLRSDSSHSGMDLGPSPQVRRSVGVPHGPGPGSNRYRSKTTLTVPVPCSRSKSTESCSSIGSSSGYHGGSSRSGTNSPMTPELYAAGDRKWYSETPPVSPNDPSSFHRTSSTHRPLGFNVPKTSSISSSSSASTVKTSCSPRPASQPTSPSHMTGQSSAFPVFNPSEPASVEWQKQRWRHWEKLTKQHSIEQKEQETLV